MAQEWEDDLREARRLARQERIRRLNSRLRNGVAGVRSSFASMGRVGSQREGRRESRLSSGAGRSDDNGGAAAEDRTTTATTSPATPQSARSGSRAQAPGSQTSHAHGRRSRARSDGYQHQRAIELQSPRRSRPMNVDLNRPLPALPTTRCVMHILSALPFIAPMSPTLALLPFAVFWHELLVTDVSQRVMMVIFESRASAFEILNRHRQILLTCLVGIVRIALADGSLRLNTSIALRRAPSFHPSLSDL